MYLATTSCCKVVASDGRQGIVHWKMPVFPSQSIIHCFSFSIIPFWLSQNHTLKYTRTINILNCYCNSIYSILFWETCFKWSPFRIITMYILCFLNVCVFLFDLFSLFYMRDVYNIYICAYTYIRATLVKIFAYYIFVYIGFWEIDRSRVFTLNNTTFFSKI